MLSDDVSQVTMHRPLYLVAAGYLAIGGALLLAPAPVDTGRDPAVGGAASSAAAWFAATKPYCNAVEVETRLAARPAPGGPEGVGFHAACFALAGKIDSARAAIMRLPPATRWTAAGIVFGVGHPVADAGDDRSAGPIMELVLEFWPNHYMALYHAGMAEYALGQRQRARANLAEFLRQYATEDGWRRNAIAVLDELAR